MYPYYRGNRQGCGETTYDPPTGRPRADRPLACARHQVAHRTRPRVAGEPLLAAAAATGLAGVLAAAHDVTQFGTHKSGCQVRLTHGGARALGDLE